MFLLTVLERVLVSWKTRVLLPVRSCQSLEVGFAASLQSAWLKQQVDRVKFVCVVCLVPASSPTVFDH